MGTNSPDLQEQIRATQRKIREDKTGGSGSLFLNEFKHDPEPVLAQPQPNWNGYTAAKLSQGFNLMDLEASRENEADHQLAAKRNTPLQQRSPPKRKATSTPAPPKKHNGGKCPRNPSSKEPAKKSDLTLLNQIGYGNVLGTGANLSSQPPPKATIPSQSIPQHKISDIQKKISSSHGAHSDMASDFNDSRRRTRGQNQGINITKTRENPAQPPRNAYKEEKSPTSHQYTRLSKQRAAGREYHHPITTDMQESRKMPNPVPRSHSNQRHSGQSSRRYRKRDDELFLPD